VKEGHILPGRGAECAVDGRTIRAGSAAFLAENEIGGGERLLEEADRLGATAVLEAEDSALAGAILLRDRMRDDCPGARDAMRGKSLPRLLITSLTCRPRNNAGRLRVTSKERLSAGAMD
jgi:cation transport ATPase